MGGAAPERGEPAEAGPSGGVVRITLVPESNCLDLFGAKIGAGWSPFFEDFLHFLPCQTNHDKTIRPEPILGFFRLWNN
jgi:hypothetical protein